MVDVAALRSTDWTGKDGEADFYLPDGSAASQLADLVSLVQACTSAAVNQGTQAIIQYGPFSDLGTLTATGATSTAAKLNFLDTNSDPFSVFVLGPAPLCFIGDSVDETYPPIADLIAWIIANALTASGVSLSSYVDGEKVTRNPGWLELTGAAAQVQEQTAVADFWPQDGMDVRKG